jgi:hypothetical protein
VNIKLELYEGALSLPMEHQINSFDLAELLDIPRSPCEGLRVCESEHELIPRGERHLRRILPDFGNCVFECRD